MYKVLRYIKVNGRFVNKGEIVDLSNLSEQEIARLEKKGIVARTYENPSAEQAPIEGVKKVGTGNSEGGSNDGGGSDEMTDEEVRAELLEKITHTVAVKELKILGAEFKANASLETLVDLITGNEEYENHFFDYIDQNGL